MLEITKDIVIALINERQIACQSDSVANIEEVKKAIREIYTTLQTTKYGSSDENE